METGSRSVYKMGTKIDLTVTIQQNPETVLDQLVDLLEMYERRFSANDETSELMAINKQAGKQAVVVHPELYELIDIGKTHSLAADSFLNIAIGPLVQAWRIGFDDANVLAPETIAALLPLTDPRKIHLEEETSSVFLEEAGMKIDLGALAKGYIADRLVDHLQEIQVESALLNLGGNLVTYGPALHHADSLWRIGIQNPVQTRGQSQILLNVLNKSVVTSGIYERKLTRHGQTFHHIFDPQTGYPVQTELASLTIVSDVSLDGEIWTTRLFGKDSAEIIQTLNQLPGIEGLLISQKGDLAYSKGLNEFL